MSAHTAGPWRVDGDDQGQYALLGVYIAQNSEDGGRIAGTFANCLVTTDEECHANARLIAAAPDGYALALAVAAHFEGTDAPLGQQARAFLAKAEGA